MKIVNCKIENSTRGFSLFIAIIIMAALLLVAFAISNLATKETTFTTFNRESQYAFFAADAGIECALYWDSKYTTNPSGSAFDPSVTANDSIDCAGASISDGAPIAGTTTASVTLGGGGTSWTFCSDEASPCSFSGTKQTRYGETVSGTDYYYFKTSTDGVYCDSGTFGGDPIPGVFKHCDYAVSGGGNGSSVFGFSMSAGANPTNACAIVIVNKDSGTTHIYSYGYNNCNVNDARRVERGIEVIY